MSDKMIMVDGHFCSERVSQIIHAIQERFPEIVIQWAPPTQRKAGQAAFRIMHFPVGREPYCVRTVKTEEEFTTKILMELIMGDQTQGTAVTVSSIEAAEQAAELVAKQRADDQVAEDIDKMYHVLKSPLNTYRLDKNTVYKDGIPFNANRY